MDFTELNLVPPEINRDRLLDSLFYTQLTLPYNPPCRWWEDEASRLFHSGYNIHDIQRAIRFHLFGRENMPRYILQARDPGTITSFLIRLSPLDERPFISDFTQDEKVDRIISLCQASNTVADQWFFFPSQFDGDTPRAAAEKIDEESSRLFRSVSFEEWVRYALGYPSPTIAWLLELHEEFCQMLSIYLDDCPEDIPRFVEIEKHLRSLSPFAYLATQRCLADIGAIPRCANPPEQWHMDFLVNPIRHLFREDMKGLAPMLMRLSALSVRFEQRYQEADRINWTRPFEMESYYLSGLLVRRPADVMARVFTFYDKHNSTILLPTNFMNPDGVVWFLNASWRQLAKYAAECYVGNPDVFGHLQDLIRELHVAKNYNAASAILHGLKAVDEDLFDDTLSPNGKPQPGGFRKDILPLLYLVDEEHTYGAYRQVMKKRPGVAFIWPHAKEFSERGPPAIEGFFL